MNRKEFIKKSLLFSVFGAFVPKLLLENRKELNRYYQTYLTDGIGYFYNTPLINGKTTIHQYNPEIGQFIYDINEEKILYWNGKSWAG